MVDVATEDAPVVVGFGLWWPAGDPGELRAMADVWDGVAADLDATTSSFGRLAVAVAGANDGAAVDAFGGLAATWTDGHLPAAAAEARRLADDLRAYADAVDDVRSEILRMAAEIAASVAIGAGLAFFTAGLSGAAAAGVTATIVARAGSLAGTLAVRALAIGARGAVFGGVGALEAVGADLVIQTGRHLAYEPNANPFDGYELDGIWISAAGGAVLGGTTGALRHARHLAPPPLPPALAIRSPRELVEALPLGRSRGGKVHVVDDDDALGRLHGELVGARVPRIVDGRFVTELADGTVVTLRSWSKSGGRAIDVRAPGDDQLTVHVR